MTESLADQKPLVLIVDDNPTNIDLLVNTLKQDYRLGIAKSGPKALQYIEKSIPDLILLDIMMPEMNGYEVCTRLMSSPVTKNIIVIFITAMSEGRNKTHGFEVGAVDYVTKPFHAAEVKARVETHLSLKKMREELNLRNQGLEKIVAAKTEELNRTLEATIQTMALIVERRDPYTAGHQRRVAELACRIARRMELSETQIHTIHLAGILHDIGKIRIPASILNRPGRILEVEFNMLKIHPQVGFDILKNIPSPWPFAQVMYEHHEKVDGTGYPLGKSGDQLMLESKIMAVADVFEAMSSHRPYRPALGITVALEEISRQRGRHFDPEVVDVCLNRLTDTDFVME